MRYTTRIIVPPRVRRSGPAGTPGGAYAPQVLGVRKSFGFGDRLGLAMPGVLAVLATHSEVAPVFVQQSIEEMTLTGRTPGEVVTAAIRAVNAARFRQPWGADADGLRQPPEVDAAAAAGFTFFTLDPSDLIRADADTLPADALGDAVAALVAVGDFPEDWSGPYLERAIDLPGNRRLRIGLEPLQRAVVKFGRAIHHCARMAQAVSRASQGRPFEIEVSFEESGRPLTPLEHLFIGLELEARGVRLTSLAPGFHAHDAGADADGFETRLKEHVAVAEFCGPYKLSFRGDGDPSTFLPILGRCCGDALHVKTSGTSYLEALRVVARTDPGLFGQIVRYARSLENAVDSPNDYARDEEQTFLEAPSGRHLLDRTYGPVLSSGRDDGGRFFKDAILELLDRHADIYQEVLFVRFGTLLALLNAG